MLYLLAESASLGGNGGGKTMTGCIILFVLGIITLILYVKEKVKACSVRAVFLKSVVSSFFIAVAICGWYTSSLVSGQQILAPFVILGLVCGLLGDIWLDLKYVFPEKDGLFTHAGFAVFGIGHLFYMTGMILQYGGRVTPGALFVPYLMGALLSEMNIVLEKTMKLDFGKLRPIVRTYGTLLFSMALMAGSLALRLGWQEPSLNLLFIGGVLFALSDLILSGTYFGIGRDRPIDIILNYAFYYSGQFAIAFSLLFLME